MTDEELYTYFTFDEIKTGMRILSDALLRNAISGEWASLRQFEIAAQGSRLADADTVAPNDAEAAMVTLAETYANGGFEDNTLDLADIKLAARAYLTYMNLLEG